MLRNNYSHLTKMPKVIKQANSTIKTSAKHIYTKIVSNTPGRLRLRIAQPYCQVGEMQRIASILEAQPNISQVRTNIYHGSILINYGAKNSSLENVFATLQDIGLIFGDITHDSEAAMGVTNAVVDLNKKVELATNGAVDLRFLFPLGLSILAARQLIAKGLQFEIIPWYVLAWYAFDSFMKLHGTSQNNS
ncbi:MAG: hypothetical protein KME40_08690 [Komarekiella atlantica HA4396-MV6]|jgi:hypothetical protein|nr:hypothetical protein [Komarekiella atlantica HA4396-MV6]